MKVFSADVKVAATAYIVAASEDEAKAVFEREFGHMVGDELPTGGLVDGSSFETLVEEAEDRGAFGTLSPAVTFYGSFDGDAVQFSVEYEEGRADG